MAWGFSRTVTIDHTKVPNTDQSNFPVKVAATVASLATVGNGGHVQSGSGFDIAFFSDSALTIALKFERVIWDATTGKHVFFVKVPTVSHTVDTVIYMAYGDATISTDQQDAANTWDANFKAVYHFGDGSTLSVADSTSNAATLTNNNTVTAAAGPDGSGAASFNGTTQSLSSTTPPVTADPITVEAMFNPSSTATSGDVAGVSSSTTLTGNRSLLKRQNNGTFNPMRAMQSGGTATTNLDQSSSTGAYTGSAWNYGAVTFANTSDTNIHPNGQAKTSSAAANGAPSTIDRWAIGARFANSINNNFYGGLVTEVRLSSVVRSDDWIKATSNNLTGLSTFYTLGAETATGVNAASSLTLPLGGSSTGTVLAQSNASAPLPIGGAAAATILIQAAVSAALPLGGSGAGAVLVQAVASAVFPLAGSATGVIGVVSSGVSVLPLPIAGSAAGTVRVAGASINGFPISGSITGTVSGGISVGALAKNPTHARVSAIARTASVAAFARAATLAPTHRTVTLEVS